MYRLRLSVFLATLPLLAVANVAAGASTCEAAYSANVTANIGCELGSTNNDTLNPLQVNVDHMFGYDDWMFAEKAFESEEAIDIGLTIDGGSQSGSWSIDDVWDSYSQIMLVLKGGAGNTNPDTFVAYLLTPGDTSGFYETPFSNAGGRPKDISHISAYVRSGGSIGPSVIPLPAAVWLMGGALGVLGFTRSRTRPRALRRP